MLPGQDSNLRPSDYTYSYVTVWRGLYHHRTHYCVDGARRFESFHFLLLLRIVSEPSIRHSLKAWLLIALACAIGVPAIHLVCNIDFSIRLLFWTLFNVTVACSTAELPRNEKENDNAYALALFLRVNSANEYLPRKVDFGCILALAWYSGSYCTENSRIFN